MLNINGTESLAFSVKSEHQLVKKGSFYGGSGTPRMTRRPSSLSMLFASNIDPNSLEGKVDDEIDQFSPTALTNREPFTPGSTGEVMEFPLTPHTDRDFEAEEKTAFSEHLNNVLKDDKMLSRYIPLDPYSDDLYTRLDDGVILCKLINFAVPGTIDERALNKKANLNIFQKTENLNLGLGAAASIGCRLVNVGAQDFISGRRRLILGVVWQLIKIQLMSKISFKNVPNLAYLLEPGEDKVALTKLSGETIILRWVNYHLKRARCSRIMNNFTSDLQDCVIYNKLIKRLDRTFTPVRSVNKLNVAQHIIDFVTHEFDVAAFIGPHDIISGNAKLNMGFIAQIFATRPNLTEESAATESFDEFDPDEIDTDCVTSNQDGGKGAAGGVAQLSPSLSVVSAITMATGIGTMDQSPASNSTHAESPQSFPSAPSQFSSPQQQQPLRNLPKSSSFLVAGTPRSSSSLSTPRDQRKFFGDADGLDAAVDPVVRIPSAIQALVASVSPSNGFPRPGSSPSFSASGYSKNRFSSSIDSYEQVSPRVEGGIASLESLSIDDRYGDPGNVAQAVSQIETSRVPADASSIGETISKPESIADSSSLGRLKHVPPALDISDPFDDLVDGLCDYHVDDPEEDSDNDDADDSVPRRTFTDGYFGHTYIGDRNFTDSNDFEVDEDMALLRWTNTTLEKAGISRRITNFTYDLSDSLVYGTLLNYMAPDVCPPIDRSLGILVKAQFIVDCAAALGLDSSLTAVDICNCSMSKNRAFIVELIVYQRTQNILKKKGLPTSLPSPDWSSSPSSNIHNPSISHSINDHNATYSNLRIGNSAAYSQPLDNSFQNPSRENTSGSLNGDDSTLSSLADNANQQFVISDEAILLWANKLLRRCGYHKTLKGFDEDLSSCEVFGWILHALDPVNCKLPDLDKEPYLRACTILDNAAFLNVVTFIEPTDLLANNPSINKLFLSNLYEDISDSDENTVMRWLNYQLYKAGVPRVVENLGTDLKDMVVYSSLLHFIANSPKPERDRIMDAEEVIKRINYICPLDFHVTPADVRAGDVHANVEMLSKLCSRLTQVSQSRSSSSFRQSLIPKRATMKARLVGSPAGPVASPSSPGGMSASITNIAGFGSSPASSGKPPVSPFNRKPLQLTGLAGRGKSFVRTPKGLPQDSSSMASFDSHDDLKKPLGRWPECLQVVESKSPHQRKLAPPRELASTKSFLEKTKSLQDVLTSPTIAPQPQSASTPDGIATTSVFDQTPSERSISPISKKKSSGSLDLNSGSPTRTSGPSSARGASPMMPTTPAPLTKKGSAASISSAGSMIDVTAGLKQMPAIPELPPKSRSSAPSPASLPPTPPSRKLSGTPSSMGLTKKNSGVGFTPSPSPVPKAATPSSSSTPPLGKPLSAKPKLPPFPPSPSLLANTASTLTKTRSFSETASTVDAASTTPSPSPATLPSTQSTVAKNLSRSGSFANRSTTHK